MKLDYLAVKYIGEGEQRHCEPVYPNGAVTKLAQARKQKQQREKRRDNAPIGVGVETATANWWSQNNGFQAAMDEERRQARRRVENGGLTIGARVEVYWDKAVTGYAGFYPGTIVAYPEEENEWAFGDHIIQYDDYPEDTVIEQLLKLDERTDARVEMCIWRFESA